MLNIFCASQVLELTLQEKQIPQKTLLIKKIYFNRLSFYFKFSLFDTYVYNPYKAGSQIPKFILIAYHKKILAQN